MTYKLLSFTGPKERDLLAAVDHGASEVINLGCVLADREAPRLVPL